MVRPWLQKGIFADRVREYCRKSGLLTKRGAVQMDVVADLFNLNEDTLRQFLYDSTRSRPHVDTLTHIASVLGCSVTEFLDAPNDPPPGMSSEQWADLTERERILASSFLATVASDGLSIAEKEFLHTNFQALKDSLLQLKNS